MPPSLLSRLGSIIAAALVFSPLALCAKSDVWSEFPTLQAIHAPLPEMPATLRFDGVVGGSVRVFLEISPEGEVRDYLITAYTHARLAQATREAVETWQFAPSEEGGTPIAHLVDLSIHFTTDGIVIVNNRSDQNELDADTLVFAPCPPERLDRKPMAESAPAPQYPEAWRDDGITGSVVVSYYIDGEGNVRVPRVLSADHPLLGALARQTVKAWRFAPPTSRGNPVLLRVQQRFDFGAAENPPSS